MSILVIYWFSCILACKSVDAKLYTSMHELNQLVVQLNIVTTNLDTYIADEYTRLYELERYSFENLVLANSRTGPFWTVHT
jgi:hypothetical protein